MAGDNSTLGDIGKTRSPSYFAVAGLTALAIVLKLKFFEIPYPAFPVFKYDLSGVPLAIIAYLSLKTYTASISVFLVVSIAMGLDPIGMAMKVLAESSTCIPLVIITRGKQVERRWEFRGVAVSTLVRVASMTILNLIVTPHWLLIARWAGNYDEAFAMTLGLMPHVWIFNASIGLIVSTMAVETIRVLRKAGYLV
jgi:hypothetical protein